MGSPVSPIVANLYMEHFEREVFRSASYPPRYWLRFVDDTCVIQQQAHKQLLLDHINSIDPAIKFTVVMYGCAVLFLGLPRGIGPCKYYRGALQYTMLIFGFSSLCTLRQNIKKDVTIVYNVFTYLL